MRMTALTQPSESFEKPAPLIPWLPPCDAFGAFSRPSSQQTSLSGSDSPGSDDTLVDDCWSYYPLQLPTDGPSKQKYLPPCAHLRVSEKTRISCVKDDLGRSYVMGATFKRGSTGKLKLFLPIEHPNKVFCVKEGRLPHLAGEDDDKSSIKTHVTYTKLVEREHKLSKRFGGFYKSEHMFFWGKRSFLMSHLAVCDLASFVTKLPTHLLPVVARDVATCIGNDLAQMSRRNYIHFDVTAPNVLVSLEAPHFVLSDFGVAKKMTDSCMSNSHCRISSYCPPEVLADVDTYSVSAKVDVWSLGVVVLGLLNPRKGGAMPWLIYQEDPETGAIDRRKTQAHVRSFTRAVCGDCDAQTAPIIDWLDVCRTRDRSLTQMVLDLALTSLDRRASANEWVRAISLLPELSQKDNLFAQAKNVMLHVEEQFLREIEFKLLDRVRLNAYRAAQLASDIDS